MDLYLQKDWFQGLDQLSCVCFPVTHRRATVRHWKTSSGETLDWYGAVELALDTASQAPFRPLQATCLALRHSCAFSQCGSFPHISVLHGVTCATESVCGNPLQTCDFLSHQCSVPADGLSGLRCLTVCDYFHKRSSRCSGCKQHGSTSRKPWSDSALGLPSRQCACLLPLHQELVVALRHMAGILPVANGQLGIGTNWGNLTV